MSLSFFAGNIDFASIATAAATAAASSMAASGAGAKKWEQPGLETLIFVSLICGH